MTLEVHFQDTISIDDDGIYTCHAVQHHDNIIFSGYY